jgi:hypothetical protein
MDAIATHTAAKVNHGPAANRKKQKGTKAKEKK